MTTPVTTEPIAVTGASGYVAAQIVKDLLAAGYRVRGTVRDAGNTERTAHLTGLDGAAERLELVSANLLDEGAFDAAVAGCPFVLHTASPYALDVEDPQRDLVDPAVKGTRNVLESCKKAGTRRVVLTSSMAAVTDEPDDRVLTEDDWNERSSLTRNPYYYSKTLAEREAWTLAEDAPFDLVVINPFLVIGPSLTASLNTSNSAIRNLLNGTYPGILAIAWGLVDVRDVSTAHIRAFEVPEASGRHLCCNVTRSMREVAQILRDQGQGERYPLPSRSLDGALGTLLVRLFATFESPGTRSYLRTHLGRAPKFDNTKIREQLGVQFRPIEDSLRDLVPDLEQWGHLTPA